MATQKQLIFCVSGFSGTGKDEFCKQLISKHGAVQTGLVDPAKRHMIDTYGFSFNQVFGPSHYRNLGDNRYPKHIIKQLGAKPCTPEDLICDTANNKNWWYADLDSGYAESMALDDILDSLPFSKWYIDTHKSQTRYFFDDTNPNFFLSPRETLQDYCELMNSLYSDTWVRLGVEAHRKLAIVSKQCGRWTKFRYKYDKLRGVVRTGPLVYSKGRVITCFSDFRHVHEFEYMRRAKEKFGDFEPVFVRIKRPEINKPPFNHRSETEQLMIPDEDFNFVVINNGTIKQLYNKVDDIVRESKRIF